MKIITNNQWRPFLYGYEVPETVKKDQFDYLDPDELDCGSFIKYRGRYYYLSDFMSTTSNSPEWLNGWEGYLHDSFFSGIVVKFSNDVEEYKIGTFIS